MKQINELKIEINKAVITHIEIELKGEKPVWTIRGKLITKQGMAISGFYFSNETWISEDKQIEIPINANVLGRELFVNFTPVIMEKLGNMFKQLPKGKSKNE